MGAPIPAKRTAAQRDRWRKRLRWFLRGLSCATGAPGLSQQPMMSEDGGQAEIEEDDRTRTEPTLVEPETHRTAVSQHNLDPAACGGQDKMDEPEPTVYGGQDKVVEMEPAAGSGQALTDRTATETKVRQDTEKRVQKLKLKNREPDKKQQHQKPQAEVAEVHPLDYLDFVDSGELGLTCQAWHTSELVFEYLQCWTSSHYNVDDDFDDLTTFLDKVADSYSA
ncbi:unnamed protein product [Polarella glacialis]|uniref:Uncharacterized protein n=1 Tax=Polarella glacialis TaxID=89957 RepID=A0A813LA67_POLGL|nr:unnamed protein product [Polarella glacialis]